MKYKTGIAGALLVLVFPYVTSAAESCEKLTSLLFPDATIVSAESVPAGPFQLEKQPFGPGVATSVMVPAFCRVKLAIKPDINVEVWMPVNDWNGKLHGVGNQGSAGTIIYLDVSGLGGLGDGLIPALQQGYAAVSSDGGHHSQGYEWATGHPELVVDWGYRATHEMTVKAKTLIKSFYGMEARLSYFTGCSNAGRMALMEVQRYPEDYDGVIAGAPDSYFTGSIAGNAVWTALATLKDPESYVPIAKLPAIADAVEEKCDAKDGVKDKILSDPERCHFDPIELLCKGQDSPTCLTAKQVETVKKIYSGPPPLHGKTIYPGYMPGSEGGWAYSLGAEPFKAGNYNRAVTFLRNVVFADQSWDVLNWDYGRDFPELQKRVADIVDANDPNVSAFLKRGSKLLLYHGWNDPILVPGATVDYYKRVMALPSNKQVKDGVRLFMVPGMNHCTNGVGQTNSIPLAH